jgi:O-antigen ligase
MIKSPGNKIKFNENSTLGVADVLIVYTMLSPIIFLIIGEYIKLAPNFVRTLIVLLGPGLLAGAIYFKIRGIQSLKKSKWIILCMMLFVLVIFISSFKHIDTESTRESLKFFIGWCLFGFCLGIMSNMSIARSKQIKIIWIVFIVGLLVYAIYQQWPNLNRRFDLPGINNAQIGTLFYFFALCALFKFDSSMKLVARIAVLTLLLACFIIGFYSGTRTAFFGFLITFGIYLFYYSHIKLNKTYPLIVVCLIIVVSFVLLPNVNKSIKTRYVKAFEDAKTIARNLMSDDSSTDNVDIRLRIWKDALNKFKKNPVLGSGFGISYHDKISGGTWVHPHNIFLEILAELGLVGGCIFLILFGLVFGKVCLILNKINLADRLIFLFYPLSLIFFFSYSLLHTDLSTEYFKWYFAGIIAGFDTNG